MPLIANKCGGSSGNPQDELIRQPTDLVALESDSPQVIQAYRGRQTSTAAQ
jgi:hypothetical protein